MKKILIISWLLFIIYSLIVIIIYQQYEIKGISTVFTIKTPKMQEEFIKYLNDYKERTKLKVGYFYLKQKRLDNKDINKLIVEIGCNGNDPYLITYQIIQLSEKMNLKAMKSFERNNMDSLNFGLYNQEIISLTIKK